MSSICSALVGSSAIVLLAIVSAPAPVRAASCSGVDDWETLQGTLSASTSCGEFLGATDGANALFSYALFMRKQPVTLPFEASLRWRRLGPEEKRSIELVILGGIVLVRDDEVGFYVNHDDVRFSHDGWRPFPGHRTHDEHRISVKQTKDSVALSVDGKRVTEWSFVPQVTRDRVGVGWKGATGYRSWAAFRDVRVVSQ